jgi:DNA repair protein RadD
MFNLRPYQKRATDAAKDWMRSSIDPAIIDASPAAGKSFMVAELARWLREISGGGRVLCLQPNSKLVKQNLEKFLLTGEYASVFSASAGNKSTRHPVVFATPLTVKNSISRFTRSGEQRYVGVLVDECHEITPTIRAIIEEMRLANPNLRVFGFTGTPYRLGSGYIYQIGPDGRSNGEDTTRDPYFVKCVYRVPPSEMLEEKFITPMEVGEINAESYDVSKVILPNGMINHEEVERAFEGHGRKTAGAVADVIAQYQSRGLSGGIMYFAATVKHAEEIYASLPQSNSAMMTGNASVLCGHSADGDEVVKAYRTQKIRHLVSVGQLTTGFDVDHTVLIATLRHTESAALLTQILGRAWRLHPDKPKCLWLDYAGNVDKHFPDGDIYNPQIKAKKASGPGVPIEAECPECNYVNEFSLIPENADFQRDKHGYCLDVFGEQILTDYGPMPAHYGRRCFGMVRTGPKGEYDRCNYRWTGKDCEACGEKNDIAARYCYVCKAEIVNPNDKLIAEFKARKKDPTIPQTERIVSLTTSESVSQRGNRTLRVDFVTEYRQFSIWLMPEPTNAKAKAQWDRWQETDGDPKTVSYGREPDSQFWRVLAYNRPADDEELPEVVMKETEKLRRHAA